MIEEKTITCPYCGGTHWKLYTTSSHLCTGCANGCGCDNATTFESPAGVVVDLIEYDRQGLKKPEAPLNVTIIAKLNTNKIKEIEELNKTKKPKIDLFSFCCKLTHRVSWYPNQVLSFNIHPVKQCFIEPLDSPVEFKVKCCNVEYGDQLRELFESYGFEITYTTRNYE